MPDKLKRLIPHAAVLICNMYIVFFLIDRVNTAMNFIDNGLTKGLLLLLCLAGSYTALGLIAGAARPARRRESPAPRRDDRYVRDAWEDSRYDDRYARNAWNDEPRYDDRYHRDGQRYDDRYDDRYDRNDRRYDDRYNREGQYDSHRTANRYASGSSKRPARASRYRDDPYDWNDR